MAEKEIEKSLGGFTGHLDSLVPSLIVQDDIYNKNRLAQNIKSKDVGAIADAGDWQVEFIWWNSKTQSNWWDGYVRSAILADNRQHLARIKNYIRRISATRTKMAISVFMINCSATNLIMKRRALVKDYFTERIISLV